MHAGKSGELLDRAPLLEELDFTTFTMRVGTERYSNKAYHDSEREKLWMRVWQVAGRVDELPHPGDWKEYRIFDQSYVIVRGSDKVLRGFVNACRHRGNILCKEQGHSTRITCPYHRWSFSLEGQLLGVPRPDFNGSLEAFVGDKDALGLIPVPVECFAGFIFLNPDPQAESLADYLGEVMALLAPYRMEDMVPVGLNVREALECNWKVVMDAFQEGYHIQGIHPELISAMDESRERYRFFANHSVATAPFGASNMASISVEEQVEAIRHLPDTFPGVAAVLPRFDVMVESWRDARGKLCLPDNITARSLLQRATRESLSERGLDVSDLTDTQMSDNQFYLLFPNFFLTIRAGEATFISSVPHPDGDPNRCIWHVASYLWLPPEQRETLRQPLVEVAAPGSFKYFLALQQDYDQMQRQQEGLRNHGLGEMVLTRQEVRLAHYHQVLDRWMAS